MFLHRVNPSLKALTILMLVICVSLIFDPVVPLFFLIWTVALTFVLGSVNLKKYVLYFTPFLLLAFGMLWTSVIFADTPDNLSDSVNLLGMTFPKESVLTGLALSLRVLSFAALSLLFIFTTNIIDFILSLMQQLKLSPRVAYGVLAGYRFLPVMKDELTIIHAAHRIRGVNQGNTIKDKWNRYKRFVIPLLASAIRKAERTAVAMESKGFTGKGNRTYYRRFSVKKTDWVFPAVMLLGFSLGVIISIKLGYFKFYSGL